MQNSALKAFAISPSDAPRLIGEFIGPKDIGKCINIELECEIDKI